MTVVCGDDGPGSTLSVGTVVHWWTWVNRLEVWCTSARAGFGNNGGDGSASVVTVKCVGSDARIVMAGLDWLLLTVVCDVWVTVDVVGAMELVPSVSGARLDADSATDVTHGTGSLCVFEGEVV